MTFEEAMEIAIEEGKKGFGFTSPNPLVGCVVLNSKNEFLSKGYHQKYGEAHAEVNALKGIETKDLQGGHVVVTLEPCAHEGKTPACAKMLSELPIESIVYGALDPNPLVSGRGLNMLEASGKKVIHLLEKEDECHELSEIFLWNQVEKKPFVALKIASSLDGQIALQSGESKWITGEHSREHAHYLRAGYSAILVGRNTVAMDDPMLNIRHPEYKGKRNKIVILDPEGKLIRNIANYQVFDCHEPEDIIFVIKESERDFETSTQILKIPTLSMGSLNLDILMKRLYEMGIDSLFVEGGAQTYSEFLSQKAFQRLYLFQAPVIIGSRNGKPWSEGFSVSKLKEKLQLRNIKSKKIGEDLFLTAKV